MLIFVLKGKNRKMKRIFFWLFLLCSVKYVDAFFNTKEMVFCNKFHIKENSSSYTYKKLYSFKKVLLTNCVQLGKQEGIVSEASGDIAINEYEKESGINVKVSKKESDKRVKKEKRKKNKKSSIDMRCKTCGKGLKPRVKFCNSCGTNVSVEKIKLKKYIEDIYLPLRKEEVSENTYRVERGFWKDILQKLGKYELKELGPNNWEGFLKYLKGKNCSPRTLALYQSTYQQSLKYALYRDYLKSVPYFRKIKKSTIPRRKITPLSPKEIELLLKNSSDMHRAIFGLSIGVGLRPSEVLTVLWEDVNFDKKEIFIKGQKTKYSNTPIPLTNFAYNELIRWYNIKKNTWQKWEIEKKPSKGLCFYTEMINNKFLYTTKRTPLKTFKTALKGAAKRAGLEVTEDGSKRRIFPYLLRHSFATIAATSNPPVPLAVAQAIMRHCSSRMLLDTYTKAGNNIIRDGLDNFKI